MNAAIITALGTGIPAIIAAVVALIKALKTSNALDAHVANVSAPTPPVEKTAP